MSRVRVRTPAIVPVAPAPAPPLAHDPSSQLVAHFEHVWATAMHDMPFVNPALAVEAVGFRRHAGDWLGVVITPWFINLFLLPGGGALWRDLPTGEQAAVDLPVGPLEFIGDNPGPDAAVAAYQYCPLLSPVQQVESLAAAREIARDALDAVLTPAAAGGAEAAGDAAGASARDAGTAAPQSPGVPDGATGVTGVGVTSPARRGFLRALGGSRRG